MNFKNKKKLIAKVLKVGIHRIKLDSEMREEIKEAITRQDIRELKKEGIIKIKIKKGRRRKEKKRKKKRTRKLNTRKQDYVKLTRKLRAYVKMLKDKERITKEEYKDLRKKIKAKRFRDLAQLREAAGGSKK